MILHRMRIYITAVLILFICFQNISVLGSFASEVADDYRKWESSLEIGYENSKNRYSIENTTIFSLTYNLNGLIETEIDYPFHYVNPEFGSLGFGFGDTTMSTKLTLLGESGSLPEIVIEAAVIIPVEYSNQEAVSQIYELEHLFGLRNQLPFMSIQANIGYFAVNDQISDQSLDLNFIYGLDLDIPLFLEKIIYNVELTGDSGSSDNEIPVLIKTGLVYELNNRIAIDGGFEFVLNDPEIANIILSVNFSI